jgi:hypothetical protein
MLRRAVDDVAFRDGYEDATEAEPRAADTRFAPRRRQKESLAYCLGQAGILFPEPLRFCLANALISCPEPVGIRAGISRVIGTIVPGAFDEEVAVFSQFECLRASEMRGVLKNVI